MKYYSDILHQLFDTQKALEDAEAKKATIDTEKAHAKETARKRREEDKEHFLELRKKFNKISAEYDKISKEYQKYADKMMETYSIDAVLSWLADAVLNECVAEDNKADDKSGIFDASTKTKAKTATVKTALEPENLGEILARIFEDMR